MRHCPVEFAFADDFHIAHRVDAHGTTGFQRFNQVVGSIDNGIVGTVEILHGDIVLHHLVGREALDSGNAQIGSEPAGKNGNMHPEGRNTPRTPPLVYAVQGLLGTFGRGNVILFIQLVLRLDFIDIIHQIASRKSDDADEQAENVFQFHNEFI